jgi:hypothetical protein
VEYALGLEPNHPDTRTVSIAQSDTVSGRSIKLTSDRLAVLSDINFSWQTSSNLRDWTSVTPDHETVSTATEPFLHHVEDSLAITENVRFYRLTVSRTR